LFVVLTGYAINESSYSYINARDERPQLPLTDTWKGSVGGTEIGLTFKTIGYVITKPYYSSLSTYPSSIFSNYKKKNTKKQKALGMLRLESPGTSFGAGKVLVINGWHLTSILGFCLLPFPFFHFLPILPFWA
jgi:hypothetical protein